MFLSMAIHYLRVKKKKLLTNFLVFVDKIKRKSFNSKMNTLCNLKKSLDIIM